MPQPRRSSRLYPRVSDQRTEFQRDRDCILYSSAFRRLAGITEVVRAGEADVFHTRQQHTFKVAQVGLRLAEKFVRLQEEEAHEYGVHPEVVEAACLAHDLGHPPFGHAGEDCLNDLVIRLGEDPDGFEGNAQSFRIVCKLAAVNEQSPGLNLTRGTLAALLKYPWLRDGTSQKKSKKWNVFKSEEHEFNFAREGLDDRFYERKTAEAEIMDWADDITYSVHDLEDFHRCGAIPWALILSDAGKKTLIAQAMSSWWQAPTNAETRLSDAYDRIKDLIAIGYEKLLIEPFVGTREQRASLRSFNSMLICRFVDNTTLTKLDDYDNNQLKIDNYCDDDVLLLKQITKTFVIGNPSLAAQQKGQKKIMNDLFETILEDARETEICPSYLPYRLRTYWDDDTSATSVARKICDSLCSLTENEVINLHSRLMGISSGSVLDPLIR